MSIRTYSQNISSNSKRQLKVVLVHDYLGEFGGAERVLEELARIWPKAPIYTSFYREGVAYERFKNRKIITSWAQKVPFFPTKLHSPLRFMAPLIWNSFDFSGYDVVISSASWYVTKGFKKKGNAVEICYCHTPPRYLYGYPTSINWQKYWPVRIYALIVNHFMRIYDFEAAQRVDYFVANSENVRARIKKFYGRDAKVIYPPVFVNGLSSIDNRKKTIVDIRSHATINGLKRSAIDDYFLVVSRIVGAKGLQLAVEVANKLDLNLKIVGKPAGYAMEYKKIKSIAGENIEFLGFVSDSELARLYAGARAFLALATDEDFGMTPVEAMLAGTPVIAYAGGGYLETIVDGKTGVFFAEPDARALEEAVSKFTQLEGKGVFEPTYIKKHAQKFSKERFKREMLKFVEEKIK
ncbi:MAG: glycosyltransferase [Candidatus Curtissbacteria bacterium]